MLKNLHFLLLALLVASCTTDDTTDGTQVVSPVIVAANPGNGRVEIVWTPNDPDAYYAQILADGEVISVEYVPSDSDEVTRTISIEGGQTYNFTIQNVSEDGSYLKLSTAVSCRIYDDSWGDDLEPCGIMSISFDDELGGTITWDDPEDGSYLVGNTVFYTDWEGNNYSKYAAIGEGTSYFEGANLDTDFTYISHYAPASNAIDEYASDLSDACTFENEMIDGRRYLKVKTLKALLPYFLRDAVHVELETGEYWIVPQDVTDGYYEQIGFTDTSSNQTHDLFQINGEGSVYDFGNSTILVDTDIFDMKGLEIELIHFTGNWNVVKNIRAVDVGAEEKAPSAGYNNVMMDGTYNVLENARFHSTGSYPYRYGYLFGKGGGPVIAHDKHCGIMIRGVFNLITGCLMDHKAFGHCIYCQGGWWPMVRDTYVQGATGSTDWVLADKRSRYSADDLYGRDRAYDVGYLTDFGYVVWPYDNIAWVEEGIRTYESGITSINGVSSWPSSGGFVVYNCVIDQARNPIHLSQSGGSATVANAYTDATYPAPEWWTNAEMSYLQNMSGKFHIEKVTTIGNQHGGPYIKSGCSMKDCRTDTAYGSVAGTTTTSDSKLYAYITLLPFELDTKIQGYQVQNENQGLTMSASSSFVVLRRDDTNFGNGWGYEREVYSGTVSEEPESRLVSFNSNGSNCTVVSFAPYSAYFGSGTTGCALYYVKTVHGEENTVTFEDASAESNNYVRAFDTDDELLDYLEENQYAFPSGSSGGSPSSTTLNLGEGGVNILPREGVRGYSQSNYVTPYGLNDIYPRTEFKEYNGVSY